MRAGRQAEPAGALRDGEGHRDAGEVAAHDLVGDGLEELTDPREAEADPDPRRPARHEGGGRRGAPVPRPSGGGRWGLPPARRAAGGAGSSPVRFVGWPRSPRDMRGAGVVMWVLWAGCWDVASEIRERRQWEMQDHEADFFAALDALRAENLALARQAGEGLGKKDPLPGLPAETARYIEAVRASGRRLAAAPDLERASAEVGLMTTQCAACHATFRLPAPAPVDASNPLNAAWMAVLFQDEAAWDRTSPDGPEGWDERRRALLAPLP